MSDDFLGSIAQEDVNFVTEITKVVTPGDNFFKLAVFIEGEEGVAPDDGKIVSGRFIEDPSIFIPLVEGSPYFVGVVNKDTYSAATSGLLKSWLQDYFLNGNVYDVMLIVFSIDLVESTDPTYADALAAAILALEGAYAETKAYAYFKTVCAGTDTALTPDLAVALAELCAGDSGLLSGPPLYPYTTETPGSLSSDPIYDALETADPSFATTNAFMTAYADPTRNGSLFSVGLMLSLLNSSGTPVGNSLDYWATANILASGPEGSNLNLSIRNVLSDANIAFFKPVGNGSDYAAIGVQALNGDYVQADWIVNYINLMCKIITAQYITRPNMLRNAQTYGGIINIMISQLYRFGPSGTGRLENLVISAPAYSKLPAAKGDEIIVPNAWSADYVDQVHKVHVQGSLIISA